MSLNNAEAKTLSPDRDAVPFLQTRDLHKRYGGVHALKGVDLTIERGRSYHLLGENGCGKSTLIKIISGAQRPSSGTVLIDGAERLNLDPIGALEAGIETVYQDLSLLPNLTVAENIALTEQLVGSKGRLMRPLKAGRIRETAKRALKVVGLPDDSAFLATPVELLPIATRQLVAIARGVAGEAGLVIMDEPTTALTRREVANLIAVIRRLQEEGTALLFVTHKLDEAKEIGGRGIVMRDGAFVEEIDVAETDKAEISYLMTGRHLEGGRRRAAHGRAGAEPLLAVDGLTRGKGFENVSLTVGRGEILGITGLLDSGRRELALALAGIVSSDKGAVTLGGERVDLSNPAAAIAAGIAYVPEDRLTEGLFLEKPIRDNVIMSVIDRLRDSFGLIDRRKADALSEKTVEELKIVAPDVGAPVNSLSGGNQQRVLIGRWLATDPKLLILNGPTVGVDVGSKETIFRIIEDQAAKGTGVIIFSDDLPELLENCERIAVMRERRIARIFDADATDEQALYATMGASAKAAGAA